MEQYGIFYFFEHDATKHTMVLADGAGAHKPCPHQSTVTYDYMNVAADDDDVIRMLEVQQEVRAGRYSITDYNFTTPALNLMASAASASAIPVGKSLELFEYPGEYEKKAEGESLAKVRIQEEEAPSITITGESICRAFVPGFRFTLQGHYRRDMDGPYVLTGVAHRASVGSSYTTSPSAVAENYSNHFVCIPHATSFRPPRVTPKPIVQGPQTAVVTGPAGEEIFPNEHGCVKVHFHWDRHSQYNEKSSCWVRVSQALAGKGWGSVWLPESGRKLSSNFLMATPTVR